MSIRSKHRAPAGAASVLVPPGCPVAGDAIELPCPRCGWVAPGVRCPRCDAVKLLPCSGDCAACRKACR